MRSQMNDDGANREPNNRGFGDQSRQGYQRPYTHHQHEQNQEQYGAGVGRGGSRGRGQRNDFHEKRDFQPRDEMNQSRGGRGHRQNPTSDWHSEKTENSGWNTERNFGQKPYEFRGGQVDGSRGRGGRGGGRGNFAPRNGNQSRNGFEQEEKSVWGSHREVTYHKHDNQSIVENSDRPRQNNNEAFGQRGRGGFNQRGRGNDRGDNYQRQGGRGMGRGSSNFNQFSSWKKENLDQSKNETFDYADKENIDKSNFNARQADTGRGGGRGRGRGGSGFNSDNISQQKPYGFNRDRQNENVSEFVEQPLKKAFNNGVWDNEPQIKNMGRGQNERSENVTQGRGGGRGGGRGSRPQDEGKHGWGDTNKWLETADKVQEEECHDKRETNHEFEDCIIHPYDPSSPTRDQKDGQQVFEEGEFLITANELPFRSSRSTGQDGVDVDKKSENEHCLAQVTELAMATPDEIPTPMISQEAHITKAQAEMMQDDSPSGVQFEDHSEEECLKDPWEGAAVDGEEYREDDFADCSDYEALHHDIQTALEDCDEVRLSVAIDLAKELGDNYPYREDLDEAEDQLYELMQCAVDKPGKSPMTFLENEKPLPRSKNNSFEAPDDYKKI